MLTDRYNTIGMAKSPNGSTTYPQQGCASCLPTGVTSCSEWCTGEVDTGNFGWCGNANSTDTTDCCVCSPLGLGDKVISPQNLVGCNQEQAYWKPSLSAESTAAKLWEQNEMGGCSGGYPVTMMEMLKDRGAGTCDGATSCATGKPIIEFSVC